jgi:hypothetical protein
VRLVIIESPFAGEIEANVEYARAAMFDCLERGESPYASHLLYTQVGVLDDSDPIQRARGIEAGLQWGKHADATVVYTDRGISKGMEQGIARAQAEGRPVEYRSLGRSAGVESRSSGISRSTTMMAFKSLGSGCVVGLGILTVVGISVGAGLYLDRLLDLPIAYPVSVAVCLGLIVSIGEFTLRLSETGQNGETADRTNDAP